MMNYFKIFALISISFILASCGFHLRQDFGLNSRLNPMFIDTNHPYSEFTQILKYSLRQRGMTLTESPEAANSILTIHSLRLTQGSELRGPSNQAQVYNYHWEVIFDVRDKKGKIILEREKVSPSLSLTLDPNQLITTNNALQLTKVSLYREAANLLIHYLTIIPDKDGRNDRNDTDNINDINDINED